MFKYIFKNKMMLIIMFTILSLFLIDSDVYALAKISVGAGDYELVCKYSDGAEVTITKNEVYVSNKSNSITSNANSGIEFALLKNQYYLEDGRKIVKPSNIVTQGSNGGHCPQNLHVYKVEATEDKNNEDEDIDEDMLEGVYNYYYSTHPGKAKEITGSRPGGFLWLDDVPTGKEMKDMKAKLVSEEFILTTNKTTTICDYKSKSTDYLGGDSISIYLFENITVVETNNRTTPLWNIQKKCPIQSKTLYLNDPAPRSVGGTTSGISEYNYVRYSYSNSSSTCKSRNDGKECSQYEFIGSRDGTPEKDKDLDPCELLGNDTVKILREVISWLQILVPALAIVLTGLDITKMVLAGNLDEELPKKKKLIIVRFIIMLFFFFAPVIAGLVIDLIKDSGVNIGDFQCLIK